MAFTLANARELSNDKLTGFVIDEFRKSALADKLVWDNNAKSNGASFNYVYNRVSTLPTAAPRLVNGDYTAQNPLTEAITATLGILGGKFELDRALVANEREVVDLVQFHVAQKTKATLAEFHNQFINGDAGKNTGEFDGLDIFFGGGGSGQVINTGVALDDSTDITNNWRTLLDQMRTARSMMDMAPTVWLMNQAMYAVWQAVMDRAGINVLSKAEYGYEVAQWGPSLVMALGDIPATSDPIIPISAGLTSIYGIYIGLDGVHGIAPDSGNLVKTYLPNFSHADAVQEGAVEMVAGIAVKSIKSVVRIDNIDIE